MINAFQNKRSSLKKVGIVDAAAGQVGLSVKTKRIASIDLLRGFVIVLMALDHVRDYSHGIPKNPSWL